MTAALFALNALVRVASAASGQLFAYFVADRFTAARASDAQRSLVVALTSSAFFVTELALAPLAGAMADRRGAHRVARWGPWFGALSMLVALVAMRANSALAVIVVALVAARLFEGASAGLAVPSTLLLLGDATRGDGSKRTRWMAAFEVSSLVAMVFGFALAGALWDHGASLATAVVAGVYVAAAVVATQLRSGPRAPSDAPPTSALDAARAFVSRRENLAFALAWLAVNAVVGAWFQHAPVLFKLARRSPTQSLVGGFSSREIGLIFSGWGAVFLLGLALWAVFGARVDRLRAMRAGLVAMLGVSAALFALNRGAPVLVLVIAATMVLIESGFTPAALAHLADVTERDPASRGTSVGLYSIVLGVGQLLGSVAAAPLIARAQMDGLLLFTVASALFALFALSFAQRSQRPS
jgi:MFS family permease